MGSIATGAKHDIAYVMESSYGVTPGTPTMKRYRYTGTTINFSKEGFESGEIVSDRQVTDWTPGNKRVLGDISAEMSYGAFDDILEATLGGTWASNVLKIGGNERSMTLQRRFTDISLFPIYLGVQPGRFTLSLTTGRPVTAAWSMIGKDFTLPIPTAQLGAPTDVATNKPYNTFSGAVVEGGSTLASLVALSLVLENNLSPTFVIGSDVNQESVWGRARVSGAATLLFKNATHLSKFANSTESSLQVTLDGAAPAGDQVWLVPRLMYTGGPIEQNGEGNFTLAMPFLGLKDPVTGTTLQLTRVPGA